MSLVKQWVIPIRKEKLPCISTMADRISSFLDSVLWHILSFLPTKQVVVTSLLSRPYGTFYGVQFSHDADIINYDKLREVSFIQSVYSFMLFRDMDQPFQRLCLDIVLPVILEVSRLGLRLQWEHIIFLGVIILRTWKSRVWLLILKESSAGWPSWLELTSIHI